MCAKHGSGACWRCRSFREIVLSAVKPGGLMFYPKPHSEVIFIAILGAEYILRWLPTGTHDGINSNATRIDGLSDLEWHA